MDLFTLLVITVILCALILLVQNEGTSTDRVLAVVCIIAEVLYILLAKDLYDPSWNSTMKVVIPCVVAFIGFIGIYRQKERSIPLLIVYTSFLQFFVEMGIIKSVG